MTERKRQRDPAKMRLYRRRWRLRNPERNRAHAAADRAVKHGATTREVVTHAAIWERDGGTCQLCRDPVVHPRLNATVPHAQRFSLDHIRPLRHGGAHHAGNLQAAHVSCNSRKQHDFGCQECFSSGECPSCEGGRRPCTLTPPCVEGWCPSCWPYGTDLREYDENLPATIFFS